MSTEAYKKRKRDWARTEPERTKRREYMRLWRDKNRDKYNEWARQYHKNNRHLWFSRTRAYFLKNTYGITQERYLEILNSQNSKCLICGMNHEDAPKGLHIDHDHNTGKIRGLLCSKCNGSLGWYEKYKNEIEMYLKDVKVW